MGCCGNWCRSCCQSLGKFALLWINFVDLACGGAAIGFGVYLKTAGADSPLIDDVALASLSGPAEPALTKALDVHAYPMLKWWPPGGKPAEPEPFYLVHYGGEYVDTLERLVDKRLGRHDEL